MSVQWKPSTGKIPAVEKYTPVTKPIESHPTRTARGKRRLERKHGGAVKEAQ